MTLGRVALVVLGVVGGVLALVCWAIVAVVVRETLDQPENPLAGTTPAPVAGATLGGEAPGSLIGATTTPDLAPAVADGARAARIEYRSTRPGTGAPTVVTGLALVPDDDPPSGGWPVIAYGHGTTGIQTECAPSTSPDVYGQGGTVAALVGLGYAVAVPDFEGLGTPGVHPYLDNHTAGLNTIDAVRALRATFPDVSPRWAAFGGSQGGGAVWGADELAADYAPELDLVGVVALTPTADVSGLVDKAASGTLTADQGPLYQWVLASLGRLDPPLELDRHRRGVAAEFWDEMSACSGPDVEVRSRAAADLGVRDLAPGDAAAAAQVRDRLETWRLGDRPLAAPLYVAYGGRDTFLDARWTTEALDRACDAGGPITIVLDPDGGHAALDPGDVFGWLADRFVAREVPDDCS